jgi:hypothetical protein
MPPLAGSETGIVATPPPAFDGVTVDHVPAALSTSGSVLP